MNLATRVRWCEKPPYPRAVAKKGSVREGLEFEAKAQQYLREEMPEGMVHKPSPWLSYLDDEMQTRHCQPDLLIESPDAMRLYIFEMKLRHTPNSAPQLAFYQELLCQLYPQWQLQMVECYKYWDWVRYPAQHESVNRNAIFKHWNPSHIAIMHLPLGLRHA